MKAALKRHLFPVASAGVLAVALLTGFAVTSVYDRDLAEQQEGVDALVAQTEAARAATAALDREASLSATGADPARVATDTVLVQDLLDRAMTWSSHEEYTGARESIERVYGLGEDSAFMTSFLPPAPVSTDAEGNEYPYIDAAGLNSSVGDALVRPLFVDGLEYSYMALVDVRSTSDDGKATAVSVATVLVTVDERGELSDISGFASTTSPRTSG